MSPALSARAGAQAAAGARPIARMMRGVGMRNRLIKLEESTTTIRVEGVFSALLLTGAGFLVGFFFGILV